MTTLDNVLRSVEMIKLHRRSDKTPDDQENLRRWIDRYYTRRPDSVYDNMDDEPGAVDFHRTLDHDPLLNLKHIFYDMIAKHAISTHANPGMQLSLMLDLEWQHLQSSDRSRIIQHYTKQHGVNLYLCNKMPYY